MLVRTCVCVCVRIYGAHAINDAQGILCCVKTEEASMRTEFEQLASGLPVGLDKDTNLERWR